MRSYNRIGGFRGIFRFAILGLTLPGVAIGQSQPPVEHATSPPASPPSQQSDQNQPFTLVGAGDIAGCKSIDGAEATAKLIEKIPGTVFAAGDLAYERGTAAEFRDCYGPTWGRFKNRTRPAPGNHEYGGPHASAYFQYWGDQAGPVGKGYYSYDLGGWHIVALNTNCDAPDFGGCGEGSPQQVWLRDDLRRHPNACIVAYGHHALFSSGIFRRHAMSPKLKPLWQDLYYAHADLMLVGHEHSYERFAPQDPDGVADPEHGIREIVVGTGGRSHDPLGFAIPNSEVRDSNTYGVLKVTLSTHSYAWEFIPEEGKTFRDSGAGVCHNQAPQQAHATSH
jgi:acid phosphatase type 7